MALSLRLKFVAFWCAQLPGIISDAGRLVVWDSHVLVPIELLASDHCSGLCSQTVVGN